MAGLLNRVEAVLWDGPDERARTAGLVVTRVGRWQRRYHHPLFSPVVVAASAAWEAAGSAPAGLERAA